MNFRLKINYGDKTVDEVHYTPDTVLAKIKSEFANWNVNYSDAKFDISLTKEDDGTETLGVGVVDKFDIKDFIG
jgi:hypothetical protein